MSSFINTRRRAAVIGCLLPALSVVCSYSVMSAGAAEMLTRDEAVTAALEYSPALRSAQHHVHSMEAGVNQARLLPNPEIGGEVENVAGSGAFSGTDAAEYTVLLSQPFLLGGKRSRRVRVADIDRRLAEWTQESTRRDLIRDVTASFVNVLADQESVALSMDLRQLSDELVETTQRRVTSGGASLLEQTKAEIQLAASIASQEQATQRLTASRRVLSTLLGIDHTDLPNLSGDLYDLHDRPPFDEFEQRLADNPDWARLSDETKRQHAIAALEDARRTPDLSVGVGWRRDEGVSADAFVFSADIPLPLFDRNQGAREAARYEAAAAEERRRAIELDLERELAASYRDLAWAHAQAMTLKDKILPSANTAFDVSRDGYLQGRFGYLDLLDAQRTLFRTKSQYVDSLRTYHTALADVRRLTTGELITSPAESKE